jgi:hypothetical protein
MPQNRQLGNQNIGRDIDRMFAAFKRWMRPSPEHTLWDDLRVSTFNKAGSRDPTLAQIYTNGSGSRGVYALIFDDQHTNEKEVFFQVQLSHAWKEATTIIPHVHWVPTTAGTAVTVQWGLEYNWQDIGENFGNTTIVYGKAHEPADANFVANRHYITDIPTGGIAGTNLKISSIMNCRLFRNSSDTTNDTFTGDAALISFDLHIELDAAGSTSETVK